MDSLIRGGYLLDLAKIFLELGQLKRTPRSGWLLVGVEKPESVAEHSFRAALMGYYLAKEKGLDAERVTLMLLHHDIPEARIGDMHKLGARYVDVSKDEWKVVREQSERLGKFGSGYKQLIDEFNEGKTKEAKLAKEVDMLECAIQAREYTEAGYKGAENWVKVISGKLKIAECKKVLAFVKKNPVGVWWKGLKKV